MPSAFLKKVATKTGKPLKTLEGYWDEAKKQADAKFGGKKGNRYWAYVTSILKNRAGVTSGVLQGILEEAFTKEDVVDRVATVFDLADDITVMAPPSNAVTFIAYSLSEQELYVQYRSSKDPRVWYLYPDVDVKTWNRLARANSKGGYLAKIRQSGVYLIAIVKNPLPRPKHSAQTKKRSESALSAFFN